MSRSGLIVFAVFLGVFFLVIVIALVSVSLSPGIFGEDDANLSISPTKSYFRIPERESYNISCYWGPRRRGGSLQWVDPNGILLSSFSDPGVLFQGQSLKLIFLNPTSKNSGEYTCSGYDGSKQHTKRISVEIYERKSPQFKDSYEALNWTQKENVNITCSADGEEPITYRWFNWKNRLISSDDWRILSIGRTLYIPEAETSDSGRYICSASNRWGTARKLFEISIVGASPPRFDADFESVTGYRYSTLDLECSPHGSIPISFVWSDRNGRLSNITGPTIISTNAKSYLKFSHLVMSDAGEYFCAAINSHGESRKQFRVTIELDGSPKFETTYSTFTVDGGSGFELLCRASGARPMMYNWYDPEEDIISSQNSSNTYVISTDDESRLVVNRALPVLSGLYTCTAKNFLGLSSLVFEVNVTQGGGPIFSTRFENITAEVGSFLEILCCADNDNGSQRYTWYNPLGRTVPSDQLSAVYASSTGRGSVLTISAVDTDYSGEYECRSRDEKGSASKFYAVQVHPAFEGAPRFENEYVNVIAEEGSRLYLACNASGEEPMEYEWSNKFNEPISDSPDSPEYTVMMGNSSVLVIRKVSLSHKGDYVCKATNPYGMVTKIFDVSVYPSTANRTNDSASILHVGVRKVSSSSVLFDVVTSVDTETILVRYNEIMEKVENNTSFNTGDKILVEGLIPSGLYQFQFRANEGPWSETYNVTLLPDIPHVIINSVQSDRIEIEWFLTFDDRLRGTLLKYEISYYTVRVEKGSYWTYDDTCGIIVTVPFCKAPRYIIAGLSSRVYYELQIRAATSAGFGASYKQKFYIQ